MSVTCTCCVLSGRGLCVGQITRPEKSYRAWCAYLSVIMTKLMVGCRDFANAPNNDPAVQTQTILYCFENIHSGHFLTQPPGNGEDLTTIVSYELLR